MRIESRIPLHDTGGLSKLVRDYLNREPQTSPLYDRFPSTDAIIEAARARPYVSLDRVRLVNILTAQAGETQNTSSETLHNIRKIGEPGTFTVTTGHQLCLFTGPLYFIYKILSAVRICEELNARNTGFRFVPVYWAATEDHDFEEVNHFFAFGKKIEWKAEQGGHTGAYLTESLRALKEEISQLFGDSGTALYLREVFEKAYLGHETLGRATRYLVNELFGQYGLITVDGNDKAFKTQFKDELIAELRGSEAQKAVDAEIQRLKKMGYEAQVNPRDINLFLLGPNKRSRIERTGTGFTLTGDSATFTEQGMIALAEKEPWKFSPNVVTRPLYQQTILPNLAYTGGPGEIAYWLQYFSYFKMRKVHYPVLVPRNSFTVLEPAALQKLAKLKIRPAQLFLPAAELEKALLESQNILFDAAEEKERLVRIYHDLEERISAVDKTLSASVRAEQQKALNAIQALEGKANRALKQRSETQLSQLHSVRERVFPDGVLQERRDNISGMMLRYGRGFIGSVYSLTEPFPEEHKILTGD